ncbi:hypothetical protein M9Y10_008921 [Tritrichomonas musculus]|uniref:Uncharacterized protein n=1 Tax=Tritrichomonas musculus TaxID=1915356 RepID=A0ABR2IZB8_9EUKA
MSDLKAPEFERVSDFTPQVKEKVLVIDKNGFDLWVGIVQSNENGKIEVHYPDYQEDETIEGDGIQRILKWTRINSRIYNNQEMHRDQQQQDSEEEEEQDESSESTESNEPDYKPINAPPVEKEGKRSSKKKGSKAKKNKKGKKDTYHPRPEGARSNPRRGSNKE